MEKYTPVDIDRLIQVCLESNQTFDKEERELGSGLEYVFEALQSQQQLYLYLVDAYMRADTPYKINAEQILDRLFELMSATEVKKFITKYKYGQQNVWLWYFYALIPEQQLSAEWATDLLNYLEEPDVGLEKSPYRKLDLLRKYERIEPKIICKALRIVSNHYEESPFVFSLYVFWILNHSNQQGAYKILHEFSNELALLEEVYTG